jgi:ADP-ribosylglycohydrolase
MNNTRSRYAWASLEGLSVGDAFGEQFFCSPQTIERLLESRALPKSPWRYTDDTVMALAIVEVLDAHGRIDTDKLAKAFAYKYAADPERGYGGMAHKILRRIALGSPWLEESTAAFGGMGSMGSGGAMRAAPIGAYFFDNLRRAAEEGAYAFLLHGLGISMMRTLCLSPLRWE